MIQDMAMMLYHFKRFSLLNEGFGGKKPLPEEGLVTFWTLSGDFSTEFTTSEQFN